MKTTKKCKGNPKPFLCFCLLCTFPNVTGGNVQQYTYKHEPTRKCTGRRPAINYSVYGQAAQVRRRRFERAVGPFQTHTVRVHYSLPMRVVYQDKGNVFIILRILITMEIIGQKVLTI